MRGGNFFFWGAWAVLCLCHLSEAASRPDWVEQGKKSEDSVYRYYIGRASADAEASAFSEALRDAQVQAIRENFGTETQVELRALENSRSSSTLKSFDEVFPKIAFDGFEQNDTYVERDGKKTHAWLLFRFAKTAIQREKLRLAKNPNSEAPVSWSEQGSSSLAQKKGQLEISSEPEAADVWIDGKRYGVTPLRLLGVLDPGRHEVVLDHPRFATYTERVDVSSDQKVAIRKKLRKALGSLSVTTSPAGARVKIEGHPAGTSPVKHFPVSAGTPVRIEIRDSSSLPLDTEVIVPRDRHEARHYALESNAPERNRGRGVSQEQEEPSARAVPEERVSSPPFIDERSYYAFSLALAGYASQSLENISLAHAFAGAALEVDLFPWWYLEFGYSYGQRDVEYSNALVNGKMHRLSLTTGVQWQVFPDQFLSLEATALRLVASYQLRYLSELTFRPSAALSQWGYGGNLRYRWMISSKTSGLLTTGWGFGLRVGVRAYSDAGAGLIGKTTGEGELQCFFRF